MKRNINGAIVLGLVVPVAAVASPVATRTTQAAIVSSTSEASAADAHIYWTNSVGTTKGVVASIGRATVNGTRVSRRFIPLRRTTLPWGIAVNGRHLYWTADTVGIGRAGLNGRGVNQRFMPAGAFGGPLDGGRGLAVAGGYIYWTNARGSIGRANLDGSNPNPSFIVTSPGAIPVAITVAGRYIYWANEGGESAGVRTASSIGRANVDGSDVNQRFIVGTHAADAVTVADGYIYWGNIPASRRNTTIGRAKLNGTNVNQRFMPNTIGLSLAAAGPYIYGSDFDGIWRAKLDGTVVDRHFIRLRGDAEGLAIH